MMGTRRAAVNAAVCDAVLCKRAWACRDSTRRSSPCRASEAFAVPHTRQGRRESSPTTSPDRVRRRIKGLNQTVGSGIRGVARAGRVATGNRLAVD